MACSCRPTLTSSRCGPERRGAGCGWPQVSKRPSRHRKEFQTLLGRSSMKPRVIQYVFLLTVAELSLLAAPLFPEEALSHVRVVRLSYVNGTVGLKLPGSAEWTKAVVNSPIQEGFELSTEANSFLEVEFENGSTARLGELSKLGFSQLVLDADGNKLNRLTFMQGYATFHFMPENGDVYSVKLADATLTPQGKSVFRADLDQGRLRVEVPNGSVEFESPAGARRLGKDKVLEYTEGTTADAFNIRQGIEKDAWDQWVAERDTQAQLALRDQAVAPEGQRYGWSDLDRYGEWALIPGYGYGWSPYAPAGWTPFSLGMWGYYPGFDWTWISSEPWGWLPYHCGMWSFFDPWGWFWMPGDCSHWQPALVTWYSGPGCIGWAPLGAHAYPAPVRPVHGHRGPHQPVPERPGSLYAGHAQMGLKSVTTVPVKVVQNGQMITAQNANHARPSEMVMIDRPAFQPPLLPADEIVLKVAPSAARSHAPVTGSRIGTVPATRVTPAPASILMGGDAAKERALLAAHPSTLGRVLRFSQAQPLRAREGSTLGGRYTVGGSVGEFRGQAFSRAGGTAGTRPTNGPVGAAPSQGFSHSGPQVLAHGGSAAAFHSGGGEGGGAAHAASSSGGGYSGGASAATAASSSAHSASTSAAAPSAGGSSSAGGGHH